MGVKVALSGLIMGLLLLGVQAGQSVLSQIPRATPIPLAPAHGTIPGWLHTDGTWIVDAKNHPIRLASVNWYGAEGATFVPGGLDRRPYMDIFAQSNPRTPRAWQQSIRWRYGSRRPESAASESRSPV
jgi:hypothetical protein